MTDLLASNVEQVKAVAEHESAARTWLHRISDSRVHR